MVSRLMITFAFILLSGCAGTAKKQLSVAQKKAKLYYNQGTRDLIAKDYTKALTNLLEAASLDPENSDIHNNLGMAYYFKKSNPRAVRHIQRAIDLNPKNTDAKLNLATIYMANGSLPKAEALYHKILEDLTYQGQHRTHYNLGVIELSRKNTAGALKQFKMALSVNPNYCPAHFKMAEISYQTKLYQQAFKHYKDAGMGTCTNNPEPLRGQIESLIQMGKYPDALAKLQDMQERFAMTDYEGYARRTILKVKALQAKEDQKSRSYSKNFDGEINAVGF